MAKITLDPGDAGKVADWFRTRGGVLRWKSLDLSNPSASWTTPATKADGSPADKPHWSAGDPEQITNPDEVDVIKYEEVKRFHIALRRGSQGFMVKLTDASTAKVYREIDKAGSGAICQFDYFTQEAVIMKPSTTMTLGQWIYANLVSASQQ